MPKHAKKKESKIDIGGLQKFLDEEVKETGRKPDDLLREMFKGGFALYVQEVGEEKEMLTVWKPSTTDDKLSVQAELRKLRNFEPIARCIEFIKSVILGGAVDIYIDDPEDKEKKETKEFLQEWVRTIHQDEYTTSLYTILNIMLDEALTVGCAGAQIGYETPVLFNDFATQISMGKIPLNNKKEKTFPIFQLEEPSKWQSLKKIAQLRIFNDAVTRLKLYRDPATWEANYWTLDETVPTNSMDVEALSGYKKPENTNQTLIRLLPWQVFWLVVNRLDWGEKGKSVIEPVAEIAKILDKILSSVGEGIYRAGNKKYFLICGTEKRPWSKPYIRNTMQQVKEMGKKNWTTIPVPAGFDIKEIGGTVFEATDVVNYFMSLIAQGMHVPLEVIGDRYARGDQDKAYTACYDEIERMKYEFKTQVENQLLKKQVWCESGRLKTKQGGSTKDIYIPELKITSRGLLSPNDRLEKIFKALNVANPINPLVKLEMEKDMAKIFGYDEIKLKTQAVAKKDLKEMEDLMSQKLQDGGKSPEINALGEKSQGQPQPQTTERAQERLKGGVSRTPKGQSKPMGGSRMAIGETEEVVEETEEVPHQVVDINVTVKTDPQKVEVTAKSEPQIIKVEHETMKTESTINVQLDSKQLNDSVTKILNEVSEHSKKVMTLENERKETDAKRKQKKLENDIAREREELTIKRGELMNQIVIAKAELSKITQESEQSKMEHDKKMQILEEAEKQIKGGE